MDGVHKLAVVFFLVYWSSQIPEAQGQGVYLQINGTRVPNHGFLGRGELSNRNRSIDNPLLCVTPDNITCCSTAETGGALLGNWYFPNGTEVPTNDTGWLFYTTRGSGVVRLHRRIRGVSGIYCCVIPDQSGVNQTLYVGLYAITSTTSGRILLQYDIEFQLLPLEPTTDPPTFTLTCVTTGGPPTNVTWRRDSIEIDYQSNSNFTFSQTVTNFTNSTYNNTLTVTGRYPGRYNVTAWNRNTVLYIDSQSATSALLVKAAAPPTHLTAVQGSDPTTVNVSWTAPVSGASVTGYRIYYQTEGDQGSVDVGASTTQHALIGLCGGRNYSIYLVALSAHLPSPVVGPVLLTLGNTNETISPNVTTSPIAINTIVVTSPFTISPVATTSSDAMNSSSFTSTPAATITSTSASTPAATITSTSTSTPAATITGTFASTPAATTTGTFASTPAATITSTSTSTPTATTTGTFASTPAATTTSTFTSTPDATSTSPFTSTPDAISTSRFISTPDSTNTSSFTSTPAATSTSPFTSIPAATSTSPFTSIPAATSTSPFTSTPDAISTSRFISTPDSTNTSSFTSTPAATSTSSFTSTPAATSTSPFTSTPAATSTSSFTSTPTATSTSLFKSTPAATSTSISAFSPNATSTSPFTSTPDITTTILFFIETSTTDDILTSPSTSTPNATSIFTTNTPTPTPAPTSSLHIPTTTIILTPTPTPTLTSTPSTAPTTTFTHISTTTIPTPTPTLTLTSTPSTVLTPTFTHISTTTSIIFTLTLTPIPTSSLTPTPNITDSTTTFAPTPTLRTTPDSSGVLTGAVVAGVVGAAVLLGLLVLVMCICLIYLQRAKSKQKTSPASLLELVSLDKATEAVSTHGSTVITNTVMDTKKGTENDNTKEAQLKVEGNHKMDRDTAVVIEEFPHDNKHVTEGESVLLHVKVTGAPKPTLVWYFEGKELQPDYSIEVAEEDGSVTIPSAETRHAGVYKLVATNTAGSVEKEVKLLVHNEEEHIPDVVDQKELRPVPVAEFGKYVEEQHANDNQQFGTQYKSLPKGRDGSSVTVGTKPENVPRNKFKDIIVYDDSRVILKPLPGNDDCQHDYINASYVDGHSIPRKFIAAQAPLPNTVIDFWRLIWQEKCPSIVMLTNLVEGGNVKCLQYWPDAGNKSHGPFKVTITDKQMFADYWIRVFQLELSGSTDPPLKVTQFHFTAWPDHGVPDYATPILAFHKRVKSQHDLAKGPLLVHCSAGVGRTGTFITIDNVLEQVEKEGVVDIAGTVSKIRQQRMIMVQTVDQYIFIHDAVLESVTCGDTQIGAGDLRDVLEKLRMDAQNGPTGLASQFQVLDQVTLKPGDVKRNCAILFGAKNRSTEHLPADSCRVILKGEYPDYINAAFVNGYKQQKAFIIAQGPMESTCRDFWKMVHERQCGAIVMLSRLSEDGKEVCYQYWPSSGNQQYGEYSVDLLGEEELEGRVLRKLNITHSKSGEAHQVTQFHIVNWDPDGRCSNLRTITDVIQEVIMVQMRTGNHPIVVHCSDTVSRSGMFCAIATTIDRCKTEGVVDILQVVKALRVQKPGAILNVEQYQTVFEAVLTYLDSFDTYANFQNI